MGSDQKVLRFDQSDKQTDPNPKKGGVLMPASQQLASLVSQSAEIKNFKQLNWRGSFFEYLDLFEEHPQIARSAYQRLYDMILSYGSEDFKEYKKTITRYHFFSDPFDNGQDAVFGIDLHLSKLVNVVKAAAMRLGSEKRVILLHGPVGSAKSTIARLFKKGLEAYSKKEEGALYSFTWVKRNSDDAELNRIFGKVDQIKDPIHGDPLYLIPQKVRQGLLDEVNGRLEQKDQIVLEGDLSPISRYLYNELFQYYEGNWEKVMSHIEVYRLILSEKDRIGIGTFQPRDEKNQDSTELTGDINYRKIAEYGSESDPRAFNFDGEFNIANRGMIEFVEMLKLDVAFLYDLLGASQEHKVKPKKFAQTDIDEVIIGHTNEPEYRKLQSNEFMEALRDRTIKIDVPYITRLSQERKIYEKDYSNANQRGKHIAPHTIEMASMWAILTRLEEPKKANLSLLQKLKLYDGKTLPGYTEDNVKELRKEALCEGLVGISPRYVQDKISNALVSTEGTSINPFMVLNELESGLKHHSLISNPDTRKKYREILAMVKEEYEDIVKNEVQRAITADDQALARLCANYIDNVKAYTQREKVRNKFTGQNEEPDERLMRSIEEKIDIPESRKDDFRREIMNYIGALALENKSFDFKSNERLYKALEAKLFEDQKDSIKLSSLVTNTVDQSTQEKIDIVKARLIKNYGYNEESATDVLNFVASIFARGDIKNQAEKK